MYVLLAVISFCLEYQFIACGAKAEALVNSVGGSEYEILLFFGGLEVLGLVRH